jgi:hypothetical protein
LDSTVKSAHLSKKKGERRIMYISYKLKKKQTFAYIHKSKTHKFSSSLYFSFKKRRREPYIITEKMQEKIK